MFILVLLHKLAGLLAAHKLFISRQFFTQRAVSTSLCASGSFFYVCLYWASSWAHREFTLPQSVSSLCSQTQETHLALQLQFFTSAANTAVVTSAVYSAKPFTLFLQKWLLFYLPVPPVLCRDPETLLWVLCFVSSRSERAEGKTDGKRWKSKKKEGTMPAQPKCSFIFIINPKCTVKAVAITRGQSFLLIWSASQAPEEPGWHTSQTQLCPGGTAWMSSHTECCAATSLKFFMCVCSSLQMKSSP